MEYGFPLKLKFNVIKDHHHFSLYIPIKYGQGKQKHLINVTRKSDILYIFSCLYFYRTII